MRILISNPDTIGDMVLRQPLLARLAREGHELALVAMPLVAPLIDQVAPEATVITCPTNPYKAGLEPADERLNEVVASARSFAPEMVVAAPWQSTPLEARLLAEFPEARRIGFAGRRYFDLVRAAPPGWELALDDAVEAPAETPELRKNQLLAAAILGKAIRLADPKLEPQEEHKDLAGAALEKAGLAAGAYLVACVGHTQWTKIRNWRPQRWAEALTHWQQAHGRDILLIGAEDERAASREVAQLMTDAGARPPAEWFGEGRGDLATLLGLIDLSRGYIGRDTGPMHLAGALGKPVLAVFGGGTWPRFCPAARPSVTLTISVPCAGCEWLCDLEDSHCIKEVPTSEVIRAIDELESGAIRKRVVRALAPEPALATRIGVEMTRAARQRRVELSVERHGSHKKEHAVTTTTADREVEAKQTLESERLGRLEAAAELKALRQQQESERHRIERLEEQLERRTAELLEARETRGEYKAAVETHRATAERLRERVETEVRGRAELRAECDRLQKHVEELRQRAEEAGALQGQLAAESERAAELERARQSFADEVERLKARLDQLQRQGAGAGQAPEVHDLRIKLQRAASDRDAAVKLSRQKEKDVALLQSRLNDLLASRWRKLGQRIGVAMTLPWEENLNGHRPR